MTVTHPWTKIEVAIRKVETGEVRVHHNTGRIMSDGSFWDFMWREGIFACDCNRERFFVMANDPSIDPEDIPAECGDGGFQIVSIVELSTGRLLYSETVPNDNSVITRQG